MARALCIWSLLLLLNQGRGQPCGVDQSTDAVSCSIGPFQLWGVVHSISEPAKWETSPESVRGQGRKMASRGLNGANKGRLQEYPAIAHER